MSASGQSILQPAGARRRVVFWRHGRTSWNAARRFQGQRDIPLDEVGLGQAARAATLLAGKFLSEADAGAKVRIVSSDLLRAAHTADALAQYTAGTVARDARLRETFGGAWEGLTFDAITAAYPVDIKAWERDTPGVRAGGGETRAEVAGRMVEAILEYAAQLPEDGTLVVTTHGGATRVALAKLLGLPEELWKTLSGLSNCHWSVVETTEKVSPEKALGGWKLVEHNVGTLPEPFEKPEDFADPVED